MSDDDLVRTLFITTFLLGAVAWVVGGFLTSAAGTWMAGDRPMTLKQIGPWLQGECKWPQGQQIYRGWVFFGRIKLTRFDFGVQHLSAIGFSMEQAKALEGVSTGHFWLRRKGDTLDGEFVGRKFSFDDNNQVQGVTHVAPVKRTWNRA